MTNTATPQTTPEYSIGYREFIRATFRGIGQVMFQNNAWTGLLFLAGIFWGSYASHTPAVAWGALVAILVSTLTGYLLKQPREDGDTGLWGFNGVLVGCGVMTFLGSSVLSWCVLVLCSAMTVWVRKGFNKIMAPWGINSLTFPFVFCTWIFIICARVFANMPPEFMSTAALPSSVAAQADSFSLLQLVEYWLRGISQVFLVDSWVTGLFFLAALAVSSIWAAAWAAIGSAVALLVIIVMGGPAADISQGLYGFSAVLTGIALGCTFYKPNWKSFVWTLIGIVATVFVQAAMNVAFTPLGLPTFTGPFCLTTWLFLLPGLHLDVRQEPDHTFWG